jgi:hypothetical protein
VARPRATHCKRGHPFTAENVTRHKKGRSCRICTNANFKIRYNANPALRAKIAAANKRYRTMPKRVSTMDVTIDYTNHRGERALRRIKPLAITFERTTWHPEPQWLLWAQDIDKRVKRAFAMKDIHSWTS